MSMNKMILMGRLVADPELKQTPSGVSVATFRVAVDRDYQDKNSGQRQADFIPCVAWRGTGEFVARYFTKGRMIAVEGSLQTRQYEDKNGGKRTAYEVIVSKASFCGDTAPAGGDNGYQPKQTQGSYGNASQPVQGSYQGFNSYSGEQQQFGSFEDVDYDGDLPF